MEEGCDLASLSDMPNLGPVAERKLSAVGIETPEMLKSIGSREAFVRVRGIDPTACLHMLYALEGAVQGVPKHCLPDHDKRDLRCFFQELRVED